MKNKNTFVFDTNTIVSAFLSDENTPAQAFDKAKEIIILTFSKDTLNET